MQIEFENILKSMAEGMHWSISVQRWSKVYMACLEQMVLGKQL